MFLYEYEPIMVALVTIAWQKPYTNFRCLGDRSRHTAAAGRNVCTLSPIPSLQGSTQFHLNGDCSTAQPEKKYRVAHKRRTNGVKDSNPQLFDRMQCIGVTYGGYGGTRTPHFLEWGGTVPPTFWAYDRKNNDFPSSSAHVSPYNIQENV